MKQMISHWYTNRDAVVMISGVTRRTFVCGGDAVMATPDSGGLMISSGDLDRRVVIQVPDISRDTFGQADPKLERFYGRVGQDQSRDRKGTLPASGFTSQVTHTITIRYPRGLTVLSNMRVNYEQRIFLIQAVLDPDEKKRELNLICFELNDGAATTCGPSA